MNWFTRKDISSNSVAFKSKRAEEDACCEHVQADPSCAVSLRREVDSFGPVSSYVCCADCEKLAEEAEENETHTCADCKCEFPLKEGMLWKWYDFYPQQGDEPIAVCNSCRVKEKHVQRVRKDRQDYEAEFPPQDNDDGDYTPSLGSYNLKDGPPPPDDR